LDKKNGIGMKLVQVQFFRWILSFFASLMIRFLGYTWRIEVRGEERLKEAREISNQVVFSFWHGRLLVLSFTHRHRNIHVLASEHLDGDLMGKTIEWLGFGHLKGSTSKGGARALRQLTSVLRNGFDVGLTVDGPRGPRGVVQQGAVEVARMSGSVVVPVSNSARPRRLFSSWDRFQFPYPFARVVVEYGEPIIIPSEATENERQKLRNKLQQSLHELTRKLDLDFGYTGREVWPHEDN